MVRTRRGGLVAVHGSGAKSDSRDAGIAAKTEGFRAPRLGTATASWVLPRKSWAPAKEHALKLLKTSWVQDLVRAMTLATGIVLAGAAVAGVAVASVWFVHAQAVGDSLSDSR